MSIVGRYEEVSATGWAEFLDELGVPELLRIAATISPLFMEVIILGSTTLLY